MLEVGALIAGKLRVERVLGRGGMGTVAVATHLKLDQRVAVKILHTELCGDPEVVERFVREARASARLRSEHVCRVSDVGQLDSGEPYIEMELLEGADLAAVIANRTLTTTAAVDYVLQACVAIAEAHALGIIHRDLKPANLFVTRRLDGSELVKVLDFGIATAPSASDFKITRTTTVMGSPGYMSPEQLRSARDADARSDIWALGCILFEAVTGRLPFNAASITELAVRVVIDPPEPIGDIDPRFAAMVMRCLEKQPEQRYQSVAELAADLATLGGPNAQALAALVAKLAGGKPPPPSQAVAIPARPMATTLHTAAGQQATAVPKRRGIALVVGAAVVLLVGGAVGALALWHGSDSPQPATPALASPADAQLVAVVDATIAIDADDHLAIRAKLRELSEQHDWSAILMLSDLDRGDPELASIVGDARKSFLGQQTELVGAFAQRGDCARARDAAAKAQKLVPDDTTLVAKAKACATKVAPVGPVSDLDAAKEAYDRHDYAKALELAEKAVGKDPTNADANREAALAACSTSSVDKARTYISRLKGTDRQLATFVCTENAVKLRSDPPPPFAEPPGAGSNDPAQPMKDQSAARAAERAGKYDVAAAAAERALKARPRQLEMLRILGVAGCHLKQAQRVKTALAGLSPRSPATTVIRESCAQQGVGLE